MNNKEIEKQAIKWSIALSDDEVDKSVIDAFYTWRQQSPEHEATFQKVDQVWLGMSQMEHLTKQTKQATKTANLWEVLGQRFRDWYSTPTLAGAALSMSVLIAVVFVYNTPLKNAVSPAEMITKTFESKHGAVETIILSDESKVTLGAASKIVVAYNASYRKISLIEGEALFEVVPNESLPFIVNTGETQTRVLGTTFVVKKNANSVRVAVKEGKVGVGKVPDNDIAMATSTMAAQLIAGQTVTSKQGKVSAISSMDIATIASWQTGRFVYESAQLKTIVADINRYADKQVIIATPDIGLLEISIAFDVSEFEQTLETIAQVLDLELNKSLSGTILLKKK